MRSTPELLEERVEQYGTVIASVTAPDAEPAGSVFFFGGWQQDPERMIGMQRVLASELHRPSVGLSVFDVASTVHTIEPKVTDDLIDSLPPRLVRRAVLLNNMARGLLGEMLENTPRTVLTHCAGANVFLLAKYLNQISGEVDCLPDYGVLAEPMIAEGLTLRDYTRQFARHEGAIKTTRRSGEASDFISLIELVPPGPPLDNAAKKQALEDITSSRGTTLYARINGNFPIILGEADIAASEEVIAPALQASGIDPAAALRHYTAQRLRGHGYLLVEPLPALTDIEPLFDSAEKTVAVTKSL